MPERTKVSETKTFAELGVPENLVKKLDELKMSNAFAIQEATIPDALNGLDILGRAPTGSGKTLAFGIPALARLKKSEPKKPNGLILSPTRELSEQIKKDLEPLAASLGLRVMSVYGGTPINKQKKGFISGVDLLIACPGRLLDLLNQKSVFLDSVEIAIIDEADRMADMGFLPDVKKILDLTSKKRQTVLFSATLDKEVKVIVDQYQKNPKRHEIGPEEPDITSMTHRFIQVDRTKRVALAAHIIREKKPAIVFSRTKHGCDRIARQLKNQGVSTASIHGGRSQNQRDRALKSFTNGEVDALIATDVAARGIHVDGVNCVIHYDPPGEEKTYVHRSGRTARAGATGEVVSFILDDQEKDAKNMIRKLALNVGFDQAPEIENTKPAERSRPNNKPSKPKGSGGGSSERSSNNGRNRPNKKKNPAVSDSDETDGEKRNRRPKSRRSGKKRHKPKPQGGSNSSSGSQKSSGSKGNGAKKKRSGKPQNKRNTPNN